MLGQPDPSPSAGGTFPSADSPRQDLSTPTHACEDGGPDTRGDLPEIALGIVRRGWRFFALGTDSPRPPLVLHRRPGLGVGRRAPRLKGE